MKAPGRQDRERQGEDDGDAEHPGVAEVRAQNDGGERGEPVHDRGAAHLGGAHQQPESAAGEQRHDGEAQQAAESGNDAIAIGSALGSFRRYHPKQANEHAGAKGERNELEPLRNRPDERARVCIHHLTVNS